MKYTRRQHLSLLAGVATAALMPAAAFAEGHSEEESVVHEIMMLNRDPDNTRERNVFIPSVVRAKVGDTVKFLATDRSHNAQSDADMMPAGATPFKGKVNEEIEVKLEVEGTYGYYCQPHRSTGMVGLILVGDPSSNFDAARAVRQRGKARQRYEEIFAKADAMLAVEA